jgi:hypothetical protein
VRLIADLEKRIVSEGSFFRRQLLKEDLERLKKLATLAAGGGSKEAYLREGLFLGWTAGNFRTQEIEVSVKALLEAVHALATEGASPDRERAVDEAWLALFNERLEKLTGCLSTRPTM